MQHDYTIYPSFLAGRLKIPPSKSQTQRAITFGAMGWGETTVKNILPSPDTDAMIQAWKHLGAQIEREENTLWIQGLKGTVGCAEDVIQCGNSGLVLRFVGALAGLSSYPIVLTGDESIRHRRWAAPLLSALEQLGAKAFSLRGDNFAPFLVQGPLKGGKAVLQGEDSQPVSGLLMAAAFVKNETELMVLNPGELPWVQLTLTWLERLGIPYERKDFSYFRLPGSCFYNGFQYTVPADFSSCTYPVAAALVTQSKVEIEGLDFSDAQGDKEVLTILQKMGAQLEISEKEGTIKVFPTHELYGGTFDLDAIIDALPLLAVMGCFAKTPTFLKGTKMARFKESDRVECISNELRKMGAKLEIQEDGLVIYPSSLRGTSLQAHHDHRLAMSLTVASLGAKEQSCVQGASCVAKSYPTFYNDLVQMGAQIK